jgi:crotonobetainyl-CoA:carnitine CoA-transferase CaiB-like acyl-CoA transferase
VAEVLDPMFEGPSANRQPHRELLDLYINDLTSRQTVEQVYREGQRRHIAFTPVNGLAAVASSRQLSARAFFVEAPLGDRWLRMPGAPYRLTVTPWRIRRPPPRLAQRDGARGPVSAAASAVAGAQAALRSARPDPPLASTAARAGAVEDPRAGATYMPRAGATHIPRAGATHMPRAGALHGVRVLEFTAGMAGPWIGRMMAWAGAEVIKVESRNHPDVTRLYVPPNDPKVGPQPDLSPWFTDWNAGKRFVGLDLTRPAAVELCKRIVAHCDVVVENYSAGVLEKLGLGYAELSRVRPQLVMISSNGMGESGPDRAHVTWGPNIEAISGLSSASGFPGRVCTTTQFAYPDPLSAAHGLVAVMAALDHVRRTGQGQAISLSQMEATVCAIGPLMTAYLATGREPAKLGNAALHASPQGCYRCAGEDRWLAITVDGDAAWLALCQVIGRQDLAETPALGKLAGRLKHAEQIDAAIASWCARQEPFGAMRTLQEAGVAAGVVQTAEDLLVRDRQLRARKFFETVPHLRKGSVTASGIPLGLTGTPGHTTGSGQRIGHDNRYVFGEMLGLGAEQIEAYVREGTIEQG